MGRIFLYSHGFATHADDGGLFSEIAEFFPDDKHVMFEYDEWEGELAVAATFSARAAKLKAKFAQVCSENPGVEVVLICHSQGCNVAMLAKLDGVKKTILLAPPMAYGTPEEEYEHRKNNKKSTVLEDGTIIRQRSAGYKTIIRPDYYGDVALLSDVQELCNQLSQKTELFVIDALKDTVVRREYSRLSPNITIKHVDADHDLKDSAGRREELRAVLHEILG